MSGRNSSQSLAYIQVYRELHKIVVSITVSVPSLCYIGVGIAFFPTLLLSSIP